MGGWVGGWLDTDNKTISVQLNLTGTGTELGNIMNAMNAERTDMKELSKPTYRGRDKQNVETERDEQNK